MPHLKVFGHRSGLAGDDLTIFLFFSIMFKLIQVGLLVPLLYVLRKEYLLPDPDDCVNQTPEILNRGWFSLVTFWSLSAVLVVITMILNYVMIKVSRRGTPSEPEKRAALSQLCAFNLIFITFLRVLVVSFGVLSEVAVQNLCSCQAKEASAVHTATSATLTIVIERGSSCQSEQYLQIVTLFRGLFVTHIIEASFAIFFYVWRFFDILRPMARLLRRMRASASPKTGSGCWNWTVFCRMCCTCTSLLTCCMFGGLDAAFSDFVDLSTALEDFFDSGGTLDVTISDIIAGVVMVHKEQLEEREECRQMFRRLGGHSKSQQLSEAMASMRQQAAHRISEFEIPSDNTSEQPWRGRGLVSVIESHAEEQEVTLEERLKVFDTMILRRHRLSSEPERLFVPKPRFILDPNIQEDRTAILEGAHFIKLALAIYGHKLYIKNHVVTGPSHLCAKSLLCCSYSIRERHRLGDTACGFYRNAFLDEAGIDDDDLLYASFRNGIVRRPYCIVLDRAWKAVVVVIRGTLSLEDLVADFTIRPIPLDLGREKYMFKLEGGHVHSGMYASAEWLYNDIEVNGILRGLFHGDGAKFSDFTLYVTGHSLGAGVAAILSLLLRSKYPAHRCLAFEPPGCIFSEGAARSLDATSYVYNHDIVPRLSLHSLENLRRDILLMLARMKVSKDKVVLPSPMGCHGSGTKLMACGDILHPLDEIPGSDLLQQIEGFSASAGSRRSERGCDFDIQLYPPGKIVHIFKSRADSRTGLLFSAKEEHNRALLTAIWADNDDFGEIELSSSLLTDHDPTRVQMQLAKLVDTFTIH